MSAMDIANLTKESLSTLFSAGKRFDGRKLTDIRDFEITNQVSNMAEGSARIKLGKTEVIVGVKLAPGEPYPDSRDKGNLTVSGDLLPLASPRFEPGPPGFGAIELPRLVDRAIRESKMIELDKLVINDEKVWTVYVDIYPINDDGNLIDAASLAAIVALKEAKIPELNDHGTVDHDIKPKKKLPLSDEILPISVSFFKLGESIVLDPTREEEEACDARVTFGVSKKGKQYLINSCQKAGHEVFTQSDIDKMMDLLPKKFDELSENLKKFL